LRFTIYHGLAVSVILHSALVAPLAVRGLAMPEEEAPVVVIDLRGVVDDSQTEQQVLQETKPAVAQQVIEQPKSPEVAVASPEPPPEPPVEPAEQPLEEPPVPVLTAPQQPVAQVSETAPGSSTKDVAGLDQNEIARTIKPDMQERDPLDDYVKNLSKKIRTHLVNLGRGRQGSAIVSFTIRTDGRIRPESLKVVESSGQPKLDASALETIRASVPFVPPPEEVTIAIVVDFKLR